MRTRSILFLFVCGSATAALAQDSTYARFPSLSADACASACTSDQMCSSWSFAQSTLSAHPRGSRRAEMSSSGTCSFSTSSSERGAPGTISGLPRRAASQLGNYSSGGTGGPFRGTVGNYPVTQAPWLRGARVAVNSSAMPSSAPIILNQQSMPASPMVPPAQSARIDYAPVQAPASAPTQRRDLGPALPQSWTNPAPVQPRPDAQPVYAPPVPSVSLPRTGQPVPAPSSAAAPAPVTTRSYAPPAPPPGTDEVPVGAVLPATRSARTGARGTARYSTPATQVSAITPTATENAARSSGARGTPRAAANDPAQPNVTTTAQPTFAAPSTQPVGPATAPAPAPMRDVNNIENFRGADGMIDAAEMRRAQIAAARDQGQGAYSVQREFEAGEAERQRAVAAGETSVDPLLGTRPIPMPAEARAERLATSPSTTQSNQNADEGLGVYQNSDQTDPTTLPKKLRGARGVPRNPAVEPATEPDTNQRLVSQIAPKPKPRPRRPSPPIAIDREPRLSGGPG